MKSTNPLFRISVFVLLLTACFSFSDSHSYNATLLNGAWQLQGVNHQEIAMFSDGYFMITSYNKGDKTLDRTYGGTYALQNNELTIHAEFHNTNKDFVGQTETIPVNIKGDIVTVTEDGNQTWKRLDDGTGPLVGIWRSGGRQQDGKVTFNPLAARKTFKMLTGTRFQWTAMNTETKEMVNTGGGTYTFVNGKYTENLEFFSRDNSKVGSSLVFDDKVEGENWFHTGKSSAGAPVAEIWGKVKF